MILSYCVECGVELARNLGKCPLCGTPVLNPRQPAPDLSENPNPDVFEEAISHMDRGYARQLAVVAVLIPMLTALGIDLIDGGGIWSPFVMGALGMLWCFFAVPLLFRPKKPYLYIAVDALALCGFLALVSALTDGFSWYLGVVMPLLVLTGLMTLMMLLVYRRIEMRRLHRAAILMLLMAALLMGMELILDLNASGKASLSWSVYAGIPMLVISLMLAGIEQNKALKEAIRKRLFI